MAATIHHKRPAPVLTVPYEHNGEVKVACLEVTKAGKLRQVDCNRPRNRVGVGTAIKAATTVVGINPCGGCQQRAELLDKATPNWLAQLFGRLRR